MATSFKTAYFSLDQLRFSTSCRGKSCDVYKNPKTGCLVPATFVLPTHCLADLEFLDPYTLEKQYKQSHEDAVEVGNRMKFVGSIPGCNIFFATSYEDICYIAQKTFGGPVLEPH